jgi:NADPH-dependent 7-cyano-7-deazaguanine reductase QueF-like protein
MLTRVEREKISDTVLKIESVRNVLNSFDQTKIPAFQEIQSCLKSADASLRLVLRRPLEKER